jgi:membrane protease YdiL (CAAX protease family)
MTLQARRRAAALFEVMGVYLAGAWLNDRVGDLLVHQGWVSPVNPFSLLTVHATNADLFLASRQLFVMLMIIYGSYFALIVPINWWYRRRGRVAYGLTRAGRAWEALVLAALATAALTQWPVLVHTIVDAVHPLGAMEPWRQAFFDTSWRRWQFWLFAGILSYAVIPVLEELIFRGYYQRRLAEDWGDGPAIIGTACFFTFAHPQYLIANVYNITMIFSLFCVALGLGIVFAWTRSLIPSMMAHAIINIPMTPVWQGGLLVLFVIGAFFAWRGGLEAARGAFRNARVTACLVLALVLTAYEIAGRRFSVMAYVGIGILVLGLALEAVDRREARGAEVSSVSA